MTQVVWFRHDLRVIDQPALEGALAGEGSVCAVAQCTPEIWQQQNWGDTRVQWFVDTLKALERDLEHLGIPLTVVHLHEGDCPAESVARFAARVDATDVWFGTEVGFDEQRRDAKVIKMLSKQGCLAHQVVTQTILPLTNLKTQSGTAFRVYTPFRRAWDAEFEQCGAHCTPSASMARTSLSTVQRDTWTPGTNAGLARLEHFLANGVLDYKTDRDRPDMDGTSSVSPWLAVGALSPWTCIRPLIDRYGLCAEQWPEGPRTWRNELVWREFYRYVMANNPEVSRGRPLQAWTQHVPWESEGDAFEAWCAGETGIDIVDAGMTQLNETGWMHNRVRMITAMFLVKNLLVDWRLGEAYFASRLIDYDFASNNGGWQWCASTGTDAAPYFRIMNPDSQAARWDPDGMYRARWLGHRPRPEPIVDLKSSRQQAIEVFRHAKDVGSGSCAGAV